MFKTHGDCIWFLTLVEDKSKTTWVCFLPDKTYITLILQEFIIHIQNQFGTVIDTLRTDTGIEFFNNSVSCFLKKLGIIHQFSCAYSPQPNGLVERKHMNPLICAKALRFHASLPIVLWGDCILTTTYLINRTPTKVLQNKGHYEFLFHTTPDYNLMKAFGALCHATVLPKPSDKFCSKGYKRSISGISLYTEGIQGVESRYKEIFCVQRRSLH